MIYLCVYKDNKYVYIYINTKNSFARIFRTCNKNSNLLILRYIVIVNILSCPELLAKCNCCAV